MEIIYSIPGCRQICRIGIREVILIRNAVGILVKTKSKARRLVALPVKVHISGLIPLVAVGVGRRENRKACSSGKNIIMPVGSKPQDVRAQTDTVTFLVGENDVLV